MEIKKMSIGADYIDIVNDSASTRNGFKHTSTLFINGYEVCTGTCYYLNRTWERYRFQSSMLTAVENALDNRGNRLIENYKYNSGIKRLTGTRKEEVMAMVEVDDEIVLLKEIIERLK